MKFCLSSGSQSRQSAKLFLQSSESGLPQPLTRRRVCPSPPVLWGGAHSLAREGLVEYQFRRGDIHCGIHALRSGSCGSWQLWWEGLRVGWRAGRGWTGPSAALYRLLNPPTTGSILVALAGEHPCTVKKVSDFPVPSRDVKCQTLPGREKFNYSRAQGEFGKWHPGGGRECR